MSPAASGLVFVRSTCQRITESINTHSEVPILSKSDDASLSTRDWRNLTVRASAASCGRPSNSERWGLKHTDRNRNAVKRSGAAREAVGRSCRAQRDKQRRQAARSRRGTHGGRPCFELCKHGLAPVTRLETLWPRPRQGGAGGRVRTRGGGRDVGSKGCRQSLLKDAAGVVRCVVMLPAESGSAARCALRAGRGCASYLAVNVAVPHVVDGAPRTTHDHGAQRKLGEHEQVGQPRCRCHHRNAPAARPQQQPGADGLVGAREAQVRLVPGGHRVDPGGQGQGAHRHVRSAREWHPGLARSGNHRRAAAPQCSSGGLGQPRPLVPRCRRARSATERPAPEARSEGAGRRAARCDRRRRCERLCGHLSSGLDQPPPRRLCAVAPPSCEGGGQPGPGG
jgi:hypothetical protein